MINEFVEEISSASLDILRKAKNYVRFFIDYCGSPDQTIFDTPMNIIPLENWEGVEEIKKYMNAFFMYMCSVPDLSYNSIDKYDIRRAYITMGKTILFMKLFLPSNSVIEPSPYPGCVERKLWDIEIANKARYLETQCIDFLESTRSLWDTEPSKSITGRQRSKSKMNPFVYPCFKNFTKIRNKHPESLPRVNGNVADNADKITKF